VKVPIFPDFVDNFPNFSPIFMRDRDGCSANTDYVKVPIFPDFFIPYFPILFLTIFPDFM